MDYGMPTLLEFDTLNQNVELALSLGLQFVEINCNVPEFQVDNMNAEVLKKITQETGIYFTFHLDEFLSITDPNIHISEAYINSVLASIEFAKLAHIPNLTMHFLNGVVFTLPTKKIYVYEKYPEYYLSRLTVFKEVCEKAIGNHPIKLCIENVAGFEPYMQAGIDRLLESKVFGLTYDCGHNHRYHKIDDSFIKSHQNRIAHMHMHDALGSNDHQALGEGEIDLVKELNFVKDYAKRIVIEVKTKEALVRAVNNLKNMI
jgi:sugar phosphate isomerase/epimerase